MDFFNTFVFENRVVTIGGVRGYAVLNLENDLVGVVWSHKHKKGELAEGQAEIRFNDRYVTQYHTWRRVFVNYQRMPFDVLERMIKEKGTVKLTIDPWQGKK